jgi:hypothetical protein
MSHSQSTPTGADAPWPNPGFWVRELVQRHADDVVLAAAYCKPNAPGGGELRSFAALEARQLLKACGAYLGERIALGATALHLHAVSLFFGHRLARVVGSWPRADVYATPLCALGDKVEPAWPALHLTDARGKSRAELQVVERDDDAWELLVMLMRRQLPSVR